MLDALYLNHFVKIRNLQCDNMLTHYHTVLTFNTSGKESCRKHCRKRKKTGNKHFLLFPQCFLLVPIEIPIFESLLFCRLQMLLIWSRPKLCCLVKSLSMVGQSVSCWQKNKIWNLMRSLTHYQTKKYSDRSKLKEIADDILKCIESEK